MFVERLVCHDRCLVGRSSFSFGAIVDSPDMFLECFFVDEVFLFRDAGFQVALLV